METARTFRIGRALLLRIRERFRFFASVRRSSFLDATMSYSTNTTDRRMEFSDVWWDCGV